MNKCRFPSNSYIGSMELRTVSDFIENDFHKILSGLVSPGLIIRKLGGGQLDSPFKIYVQSGKGSESDIVKVTPGLFVSASEGVTRIFELKDSDLHINNLSAGLWYVCLVPDVIGYEDGRVSFTEGSDSVSITGGAFTHLRPFASIIAYEENSSAPFGAFKVVEVSGNRAKLSAPYPGESKANMKWKAGARFPENTEPSGDEAKVMFEFNTCDVMLSDNIRGILLGTVTISDQSGIKKAALASDRRSESLAVFYNNGAYADDVRPGTVNSITTIDEKAQAARVYNIVSDFFTPAVRTGGSMNISGTTLTVNPFTGYDSLGRRIESLSNKTFDLPRLVAEGKIKEGVNPLYAFYAGTGKVDFGWSENELANPNVLVGYVTYTKALELDNNTIPDSYSASTLNLPKNSIKAGSLISSGRNTAANPTDLNNKLWSEGELYYNTGDQLYYYVKKLANNKLAAEKLVSKTMLNTEFEAFKYLERLRFTLYPFDNRNNWFLFNGLAAPAPVGYEFVIVQWKIGVLDTVDLEPDNNSIVDYMGNLSTGKKVASDTCNWRNIVTKTNNLSSTKYNAGAALGVYLKGKSNPRVIELRVNGNIADIVNMENDGQIADSGGGTSIFKLYTAEVTIQLTSGIRYAVPEQQQD